MKPYNKYLANAIHIYILYSRNTPTKNAGQAQKGKETVQTRKSLRHGPEKHVKVTS